jgi:hypothetical protein
MNLFDGKFDLVDGYYVDENTYKIQGNYTDNTGTYSSYDVQVGDLLKKNYDTYYEPFCGGCAILISILEKESLSSKFKSFICLK